MKGEASLQPRCSVFYMHVTLTTNSLIVEMNILVIIHMYSLVLITFLIYPVKKFVSS